MEEIAVKYFSQVHFEQGKTFDAAAVEGAVAADTQSYAAEELTDSDGETDAEDTAAGFAEVDTAAGFVEEDTAEGSAVEDTATGSDVEDIAADSVVEAVAGNACTPAEQEEDWRLDSQRECLPSELDYVFDAEEMAICSCRFNLSC